MDTGLKVDGNVIKGKLSSGGDPVMVRSNYTNEVEVVCKGRLVLAVYDMPEITLPEITPCGRNRVHAHVQSSVPICDAGRAGGRAGAATRRPIAQLAAA
jgi:hypothetical protein